MGWIILFGPLLGGIVITVLQVCVYRGLIALRILREDMMPPPPVIVIRSFIILIVLFTAAYFTGLGRGHIDSIDINTIPESFGAPSAAPATPAPSTPVTPVP